MAFETDAEHNTLVDELTHLESLSPQERLNHAKNRRQEQLTGYKNRHILEGPNPEKVKHASHNKRIKFDKNIEIIEAAARNDADEVGTFIRNGFSPDLQNEDGLSALHQAVIEDCVDVVNVLVENNADLNIKDADLWTPLHAAVACGNYDLVKYLCESGASMVEINTDGNMPIDLVEDNEDIEYYLEKAMAGAGYTEEDLENIRNVVAKEMLRDLRDSVTNKRDLNKAGEHGETAMHIAAANGYEDVIEYLLDHGADISVVDNDHWQPVHAAACWGQDKIIELLVNHGADLDAKTKDGEMPIDLTEDEELQGMIAELKESGHIGRRVERSQSNSSRTLSVRRSSIVEKHRISVNDAKQEGIFRQNTEFLNVVIKTDEDGDHEDGQDQEASQPSPVQEEEKLNEDLKVEDVTLNIDDGSTNYKAEEKITMETEDRKETGQETVPKKEADTEHSPINNTKNRRNSNKDIDLESGNNRSHNTAAKRDNHKTLTESSDVIVKKKCCVIL